MATIPSIVADRTRTALARAPEPERTLRILYLEDSVADAERVFAALAAAKIPHDLCRASSRATFELGLARLDPHAILVDCVVPGWDGLSAVRLARARRPGIPIILVTGAILGPMLRRLFTEGASAYVDKDEIERLPEVLRYCVGLAT